MRRSTAFISPGNLRCSSNASDRIEARHRLGRLPTQPRAHARAHRPAARARNPHARRIGEGQAALREARADPAARTNRAATRSGRAVARALLDGGVLSRRSGSREVDSRRRHDRWNRSRVGRARDGRRKRCRHRRGRNPAHGPRKAPAHAEPRGCEQAPVRAPGRVGGRKPAQVPGGRLHPRRCDLLQPGEAFCRGLSGRHRGARLVDCRRCVHAGAVRLRDHGARARQGVSRRSAAPESRDRRDCDGRGARWSRDAYARLGPW